MSLYDDFMTHPDIAVRPGKDGEAKAWCPWHEDREGGNPSLGINVRKKIVKCFVCGNGGAKALATAWGIGKDTPPWERKVEATYDYLNPDGSLRFQVVRTAGKRFFQRRPNPAEPGRWVWNMKGLQPTLYALPDLRAADKERWVWLVEGEKDADRLRGLGLVSTTNSMGAGKWRKYYNRELKNRLVAIAPDNDGAGMDHARAVASSLSEIAQSVKIVRLPGLADKGDVSDWLNAGHSIEELDDLLSRTPTYDPADDDERTPSDDKPDWKVSSLRPYAVQITELLNQHGYFVNGDSDAYFFDQDERRLVSLDKDDRDLRILLSDRYQINRQDQLYNYLLEHMLVEAHQRGRSSLVRQFSYYDFEANVVHLDMGLGRALRISESDIELRNNGEDGVLFLPMPDQQPWEYEPMCREGILYEKMIAPVNFSGDEVFTVSEQRTLLLLWLLSMAFESMMPTKVLVMAVGPGESGKSSLFRNCGRMLIGPDFEVDSLLQDQKGEEDFWVNLSHSFYVTYDNVDQVIRWLPDALAQVATGIRRSKRQLHTTNQMNRFKVSCMVAVTARTPSSSLRREDVAGRTLVFVMKTLNAKIAEYEIQEEIAIHRNELMSDYARMVQRGLRVSLSDVEVMDPGMRMADFARVATRLGMGLGERMAVKTAEVMAKVRPAQNRFATEEDSLVSLLNIWIGRSAPRVEGAMDMGEIPNNGRQVTTRELLVELNAIARQFEMRLRLRSPEALGRQLTNMSQALSEEFKLTRGHSRKGKTWQFETISEEKEKSA